MAFLDVVDLALLVVERDQIRGGAVAPACCATTFISPRNDDLASCRRPRSSKGDRTGGT